MTPVARIINSFTSSNLTSEDIHRFDHLRQTIPGWTTLMHMAFFKATMQELFRNPQRRPKILVCGVYHGMDVALIHYFGGAEVDITGVDLFSSEACADWPEDKRHMTWEQAFGCLPPSFEAARRNCPDCEIVQSRSVNYLAQHSGEFDFIYLDTSHDETTVRTELGPILVNPQKPGLIVAGDDYAENGGGFDCGVARAVEALLPAHNVLFNRIWISQL